MKTITEKDLREKLNSILYSSSILVKSGYSFQKDDGSGLGITYKLKSKKDTYEMMLPISNIAGDKNIKIQMDRGQAVFEDMEEASTLTVNRIVDFLFDN